MSDAIDFILLQSWEPEGKRVRTIESAGVFTERARKLMARYRRVTDVGVPPPEEDQKVAEAISELAGRTMTDTEFVYDVRRFLKFSGWSQEHCFGLACNIVYANLEPGDQFAYVSTE
jgi:hypothetical protein